MQHKDYFPKSVELFKRLEETSFHENRKSVLELIKVGTESDPDGVSNYLCACEVVNGGFAERIHNISSIKVLVSQVVLFLGGSDTANCEVDIHHALSSLLGWRVGHSRGDSYVRVDVDIILENYGFRCCFGEENSFSLGADGFGESKNGKVGEGLVGVKSGVVEPEDKVFSFKTVAVDLISDLARELKQSAVGSDGAHFDWSIWRQGWMEVVVRL